MTLSIKNTFSSTNIIIIIGLANLLMLGFTFSYFSYTTQIADQYRASTNRTATELVTLTTAIHDSDNIRDNQTKHLLQTQNLKADRNYLILANGTNQTNTLVKFLTDNFGVNSGYIERENFQYGQANDTLKFLKMSLRNQELGLHNQDVMIHNQEIIKANQEKILNQTRTRQ